MDENEKTKKRRQAYYLKNREKILKKQKENKSKTREYKNKYRDKRRKELRDLIDIYKSKCIICGETNLQCLDFHHIKPDDKILGIGEMIRNRKYSIEDITKEISKCKIICSNCHRKEHE